MFVCGCWLNISDIMLSNTSSFGICDMNLKKMSKKLSCTKHKSFKVFSGVHDLIKCLILLGKLKQTCFRLTWSKYQFINNKMSRFIWLMFIGGQRISFHLTHFITWPFSPATGNKSLGERIKLLTREAKIVLLKASLFTSCFAGNNPNQSSMFQ